MRFKINKYQSEQNLVDFLKCLLLVYIVRECFVTAVNTTWIFHSEFDKILIICYKNLEKLIHSAFTSCTAATVQNSVGI